MAIVSISLTTATSTGISAPSITWFQQWGGCSFPVLGYLKEAFAHGLGLQAYTLLWAPSTFKVKAKCRQTLPLPFDSQGP